MGKSFNNDVFKSGFNVNGIGISSEAIEENKKALNLDQDVKEVSSEEELKEAVKSYIKDDIVNNKDVSEEESDKIQALIKNVYKDAIKDMENEEASLEDKLNEVKEKATTIKEEQQAFNSKSDNTIYTKKTMIFKQEYLDIIDGLAIINDMQIKDVLNQLLEQGIEVLREKDNNLINKALKEAQKKDKSYKGKNLF
jgi:hypothetical protein